MYLYVIFDKVSQDPAPIMQCKNDQVAIRAYEIAMENAPFPEDYKILKLAKWQPDILSLQIIDPPEEINLESLYKKWKAEDEEFQRKNDI